jgi:hypothetical protein
MQSAILQSSVHMPILPALASKKPLSIAVLISLNPSLIMEYPYLVKGWNSVLAPSASQMASPSNDAIHFYNDLLSSKPKNSLS